MFASLTSNISKIFDKLKSSSIITQDVIDDTVREIRIALLEADVALSAVKEIIETIKVKALGQHVVKSVTPGQMLIKIISDELTALMQSDNINLNLQAQPPVVIMMIGLQGSGKTTTTAKLAKHLIKKHKKSVLMASLDTYRPKAQEQLEVLGSKNDIRTLPIIKDQPPLDIARRAIKESKQSNIDILILDTAGRVTTNADMMHELQEISKIASPIEKILVADALTGQDALRTAQSFDEAVNITGIILTRLDADAKAGAALSIKHITNKPIKFIGLGESADDLEIFDPERIVSRILGKGDIVGLVEKAQEFAEAKESEKLEARLKAGKFDLNDLAAQLNSLNKLGGMTKLIGMIPGVGKMMSNMPINANFAESMVKKTKVIIDSMTPKERRDPNILNASRKKRIALGSGTKVEDINKLLKQYITMSKMVKRFKGVSPNAMMPDMKRFMNGQF